MIDNLTMKKNRHDIVIGSGLSGLSAALGLCNNGIKPMIFEKNAFHGGYATNVVENGFRFEVSLHYTSPLIKSVIRMLGLQVKLIEVKKTSIIDLHGTSQTRNDFYNNDQATSFINVLELKYPNEKESIRKFFSIGRDISPMSDDLLFSMGNTAASLLKNPKALIPVGRYIGMTARQVLNEFFTSEGLKRDISAAALVLGTPFKSMNAIPFIVAATDQFERGAYYIHGGSQALVDAMRAKIERLGGEFIMESPVTSINIVDGAADSITTNGKKIAVKSVINCTDIFNFLKMVKPATRMFKVKTNRPIGLNAVVLHLGLDFDVRTMGFTAANYSVNAAGFSFDVAIYSNIDPTCCPPNGSVITLTGIGDVSRFKPRSIRILSSLMNLDITNHVIAEKIYTPNSFKQLTWNTNGTYVGFQATGYNLKKPIPASTIIQNIFVAGQWTGVGGGYVNTMLSGIKAARLVQRLRDV